MPRFASDANDGLLGIVNQDDPLQVILRGHLLIETELTSLIERALPKPEHLDIEGLSFLAKANLAAALACLPVMILPALKRLNAVRNRFAHRLDTSITDEDIRVMYNGLGELKEAFAETRYAERDNVGKLGGIVMGAYHAIRVSALRVKGMSHEQMVRHLARRSTPKQRKRRKR